MSSAHRCTALRGVKHAPAEKQKRRTQERHKRAATRNKQPLNPKGREQTFFSLCRAHNNSSLTVVAWFLQAGQKITGVCGRGTWPCGVSGRERDWKICPAQTSSCWSLWTICQLVCVSRSCYFVVFFSRCLCENRVSSMSCPRCLCLELTMCLFRDTRFGHCLYRPMWLVFLRLSLCKNLRLLIFCLVVFCINLVSVV